MINAYSLISALFVSLSFLFTSCIPSSRLVNVSDNVRDVNVYRFSTSKTQMSRIDRQSRTFNLSIHKEGESNDDLVLKVESVFLITQNDYNDTAYMIVNNVVVPAAFPIQKNLHFQEKLDNFTTNTQTNVTVSTDKTTETNPVEKNSNNGKSESTTTTTTDTKTTTSTSTDTDIRSQILDKTKSVRYLKLREFVNNFSAVTHFKIRIYDTNNDFWDVVFSSGDIDKLNKLFKGEK